MEMNKVIDQILYLYSTLIRIKPSSTNKKKNKGIFQFLISSSWKLFGLSRERIGNKWGLNKRAGLIFSALYIYVKPPASNSRPRAKYNGNSERADVTIILPTPNDVHK